MQESSVRYLRIRFAMYWQARIKEWVYVESGDVRGFVKSEYLLMGDEAAEKAKTYTDAGQDPETVCGLADTGRLHRKIIKYATIHSNL